MGVRTLAMSKPEEFRARFPHTYFLDPGDLPLLAAYLTGEGWIAPPETLLGAEKAGEGNMNCTVRVRTSTGSFILKQSRPWLEKYPQIAAPFDRALAEGRFYRLVARSPTVAARMPRLLWTDDEARTVALEDLGEASDFFPLYAREIALPEQTLVDLVAYLSALHPLAPADELARESLANYDMRALNHEHIFALPLRAENGLDLDAYTGTPGLGAAAALLKEDAHYVEIATELGERYLHGSGRSLLHGDFFLGSFLQTSAGVRVIDPEFCFCGDAEFDLGVFAAHLLLAREPAARAERALELYESNAATRVSPELTCRYAGVEIMRRLLGVAQIPTLRADLAQKTAWLELSRKLVLQPELGF
jgi:5-methylthioribose kinase